MKRAVQLEPVGHIRIAGNQAQSRVHFNRTAHDRRIGAHAQLQQVFNLRMIEDDIEFYIVTLGCAHPDHRAVGGKRRMKECRIHRLEICVPARAVNDGVELGVQRHRVPAARNSKIWRIGFSMHGNVAESSRVLAGG